MVSKTDDAEITRQIKYLIKHAHSSENNYQYLKLQLDKLKNLIHKYGVSRAQLKMLVYLVTTVKGSNQESKHYNITLPNSAKVYIVRNLLFPRGVVSDKIIIKIIGSLGLEKSKGQKFPNRKVQELLLKWVVCISFLLKNESILSTLSLMIFHHLNADHLTQQACHLLYIAASKNLVSGTKSIIKPWMVLHLLKSIKKKFNSSPYIIGLLHFYVESLRHRYNERYSSGNSEIPGQSQSMKNVESEAILRDELLKSTNVNVELLFKYPDFQFLTKWLQVLTKNCEDQTTIQRLEIGKARVIQLASNPTSLLKRRKLGNGDDGYDSYSHSFFQVTQTVVDTASSKVKEIVWSDLNNVEIIATHLGKLRMPPQVKRLVTDNYFYQLLVLSIISNIDDSSAMNFGQFTDNVDLIFSDYNPESESDTRQVKQLLEGIYKFQKLSSTILLPAIKFVRYEYSPVLTSNFEGYLWKFWKLFDAHGVSQNSIIDLYEKKFVTQNSEWCSSFLHAFIYFVKRQLCVIDSNDENEARKYEKLVHLYSCYERISRHIVHNLQRFEDRCQNTIKFQHITLEFIQLTEKFPVNANMFNIVSPFIFYRFLLANDINLLNKLCRYAVFLKNFPLTTLLNETTNSRAFETFIALRNRFVLDLCNLLWRHKIFTNYEDSPWLLLHKTFIESLKTNTIISHDWFDLVNNNPAIAVELFEAVNASFAVDSANQGEALSSTEISTPITAEYFDKFRLKVLGTEGKRIEKYSAFRLSVLRKINNELQYQDICELLYTSLKSLSKKRESILETN